MGKTALLLSFMILLLSLGCAGGKVSKVNDNKALAVEWYKKGNEYAAGKDFTKATEAYSIAITYDGLYTDAYINRGNALTAVYLYQAALDNYAKALELQPNSAEAYLNRGYVYIKLQQYDKALEDFDKSVELDNRSALAYLNRSKAFFYLTKPDKALSDINKAVELDVNLANAYNFRGIVLISDKERDNSVQALADFRKGCDKGDPDACSNLKQVEKSLEAAPAK